MTSFHTNDSDSEIWDDSSDADEIENESTDDILNFCTKITEELLSTFRRNIVDEDCCGNIYEDKFNTPKSGSYSYYADILSVAQMNEKGENGLSFTQSSQCAPKNIRDIAM